MRFARIVCIALLPALMTVQVYAQSQTNVTHSPNISYDNTPQQYMLGGINIDDVKGYDRDVLMGVSGLTIGQTITVPGEDVTKVVNRYWKQGLFSDVRVAADSIVQGRIYLHIHLEARPRISSIQWEGVKKSDREALESKLGLVVGNQVTPDITNRAELIIKKHFEEKGYKDATVNIIQREDIGGENKVMLDINVDRHEKIKVNKIFIEGVDNPKLIKKIKSAMKKTKESTLLNFFKSKKFLPEKYTEDKTYVIDKLNEYGYRDALILSDSIHSIDAKHIDIYLKLYQGQKYYIRNIEWVGNTVFSATALNRTLHLKKGDVYNQKILNDRLSVDDDAIGNQYYNNGYVFYHLEPVEQNIQGDSIDLEMRISEGVPATLGRIRISGNSKTYENVVRRELRTKPGDLFNRESLMRSLREIASMSHFDPEQVKPDVKPNPNDGTVDINYSLVPKSSDQLELSAGWGQTGIVGKVGIKFTNFSIGNLFGKGKKRGGFLPQGDGQTLSISGQTNGTFYQSYNISFLDPWFGGKRPNQFQVSLFFSKQTGVNSSYYSSYNQNMAQYSLYNMGYGMNSTYNYTNYLDPDQYIKMYGGSIGFGKRLRWPDDYFTVMAQLSFTRYDLRNWIYFLIHNGASNNLNVNLTLSRTSTDNNFFPRRGSELLFQVSLTPPFSLWDGKDYRTLAMNPSSPTYDRELRDKYRWVEYHKWKFKFRSFTALTSKPKTPVLMTRMEFGILGSYNKYNKSPFETYFVGGDGMSGYSSGYATETIGLRGYDNGSLTPQNYEAYAYSRMSLELRYPLLLEGSTQIYMLGFLEGGNAWQSTKNFNPFNMKRSAGIGVRLFLPMVGLIGMDWAYGFDSVFGDKSRGGSHFHFIIGQEF